MHFDMLKVCKCLLRVFQHKGKQIRTRKYPNKNPSCMKHQIVSGDICPILEETNEKCEELSIFSYLFIQDRSTAMHISKET